MKAIFPLRWALVFFLTALPLFADGCFIPPTAYAQVRIPDQRALIHYANGVETLVIDTSFQGAGTNFAWIVPVPSRPQIRTATTGLFPTLERLFQPRVVHYIPHFWIAAFIIALLLSAILQRLVQAKPVLDILLGIAVLVILSGLFLPALGTASTTASSLATERCKQNDQQHEV